MLTVSVFTFQYHTSQQPVRFFGGTQKQDLDKSSFSDLYDQPLTRAICSVLDTVQGAEFS